MGMYDRDWYKEKHQKQSGRTNKSGRSWSDSERDQWQSKLDAANRKGRRSTLVRNIILFFALSFGAAFAIKTVLGKDDFSLQTFFETLGMGKTLGTAPGGRPWPAVTGYMPGNPVLATQGRGSITIDNLNGKQDAFVQLMEGSTAVRQAFVRSNEQFQFATVTPATYELRVLEVQSGKAYRVVEPIVLGMTKTGNSTSWESKTIRLNAVSGNLTRERISRARM